MPPGLVTVYDIRLARFPWLELVAPSFLFLASTLSWLLWLKHRRPEWRGWRKLAWAGLALSIIWAIMVTGGGTLEFLKYRTALSQGRTSIVEGLVHDFKAEPPSGAVGETFSVAGKTFWYSRHASTPGFNQAKAPDGPIREGVYVRIHFVDDNILLLEVERGPHGSRGSR